MNARSIRRMILGGLISCLYLWQAPAVEARTKTKGNVRIAAILITFYDDPQNSVYIDDQPVKSSADLSDFLFESPRSLNAYIREASYGKMWLSGEVFGPFEIPVESPSEENTRACRVFDEVVAAADGSIDFSLFDIILIVYPRVKNENGQFVNFCEFQGLSGSRSNYTYDDGVLSHAVMWINGFVNLHILAHELGHLMGLGHANAWKPDPSKKWPYTYGSRVECGDPYSVMGYDKAPGYTGPGQFSASEKDTIGWFEDNNVMSITKAGSYRVRLAPLEQVTDALITVKVKLNKWQCYFLEYRRATGFDAHLENIDGLFIMRTLPGRFGVESNRFYTSLEEDRFVLPVGESFIDLREKLRIKPIAMDENGITVDIAFGAPDLTISTPAFNWPNQVVPGDTLRIPFVIENRGVADIRQPFHVGLFIYPMSGGERVISQTVESLLQGQSESRTIDWNVGKTVENVRLRLYVDYDNFIPELDENDNVAPSQAGFTIDVRPRDILSESDETASFNAPLQTMLIANYPNPFNSTTIIRYQLAQQQLVELLIFNANGQCVRTLFRRERPAGEYTQLWDGKDDHDIPLSSGIYICSLTIQGANEIRTQSRRLTLIR